MPKSSVTSPRRRLGRRPGAPETQSEIVDAARGLFATHGYAGTSIRAVATAAGVDPALVHHYFGTKEGLFRAALEVPVDVDSLLNRVLTGERDAAPVRLAETFLDVWDSPETGPAMLAFLRRVLADATATDLVRQFAVATVMKRAAAGLLADVEPADAQARVSMVFSQLLGVVVARRVLRIEPLAGMAREELVQRVSDAVATHLRGVPATCPLT
jgi:AcrR family transcriptional regulator